MWLFALFVILPIVEIALFIQIGGLIGLWPTLALVILAALLGMTVIRSRGAHAASEVQRSLAELRDPSRPIAHGMMIVVAGILLIIPGFFTDAVGLLLLIPPVRELLMRRLGRRIEVNRVQMGGAGFRREAHRPPYGDGVIDGDYVVDDDVPVQRYGTPPDLPLELPDEDDSDDGTHRGGKSGWTRH